MLLFKLTLLPIIVPLARSPNKVTLPAEPPLILAAPTEFNAPPPNVLMVCCVKLILALPVIETVPCAATLAVLTPDPNPIVAPEFAVEVGVVDNDIFPAAAIGPLT